MTGAGQPAPLSARIASDVYAAIAEVERLRKIAKAAEDAVKAAVRAIPRISEDDVAGLIRAATEKHEV